MTTAQPSGAVCSVAPWKGAPPRDRFLLEHEFEYIWDQGLASGVQQICGQANLTNQVLRAWFVHLARNQIVVSFT